MAEEQTDPAAEQEEHEGHGMGALFLMAIFMILLVATWFYTYTILLARG